jgi:hypothetical protein
MHKHKIKCRIIGVMHRSQPLPPRCLTAPHVAREDMTASLGQLVSRPCLVLVPPLTSQPLLAHATPLPHCMRTSWHWLQCTRRPDHVVPIPPSGGDPSADLAVLSPLPTMADGAASCASVGRDHQRLIHHALGFVIKWPCHSTPPHFELCPTVLQF